LTWRHCCRRKDCCAGFNHPAVPPRKKLRRRK
jgi:hypothetical protein